MSEYSSKSGGLIPALIVAAGLIGASLILSSALDRTARELVAAAEMMGETLTEEGSQAVEKAAPSRLRRPAARKEYKVTVGDAPVRGSESAAITIVEWSDFQCSYCSRAMPTLVKIQEEYGPQVRIAFKHLPLSIHARAPAAHAAAEAAHEQGQFWEMHDKIFANPRDLSPSTFERYAREIGLDVEKFRRDTKSNGVKKRIDDDMRQAEKLGVSGTPSFFINGRFLSGAQPFGKFKQVIDEELERNF